MLDRWIGAIDVAPDSSAGEEPFAIADLPARVAQLIDQIQGTLPERPWHEVNIEEGTNLVCDGDRIRTGRRLR